jgi:hypothetical protein
VADVLFPLFGVELGSTDCVNVGDGASELGEVDGVDSTGLGLIELAGEREGEVLDEIDGEGEVGKVGTGVDRGVGIGDDVGNCDEIGEDEGVGNVNGCWSVISPIR